MATIKMTLSSSALDGDQTTEFQVDDEYAREAVTYYDFGLAALRANCGVHLATEPDGGKAIIAATRKLGPLVEE